MHPRARDVIGAGLLFAALTSLVAILVFAEYLASTAN
jgi:hypothetical protein